HHRDRICGHEDFALQGAALPLSLITRFAGRARHSPWPAHWSAPPGRQMTGGDVQVVLTTITVQSALCVTVFVTLPSTRRFIPLLPITRRSAPHSSASCTSTSPGSPWPERVSHSIPSSPRSALCRSSTVPA